MLRSFRERYLPLFQVADAPSSPAPASGGDTPSSPSATPSSSTSASDSSTTPVTPSPDLPTPTSTDGDSSFDFMFNPEGGDPLDGPLAADVKPKPEPKPAKPAKADEPKPAAKVEAPTPAAPQPPTPAPAEPTSAAAAPPNLDPHDPGALAQHLAQNEGEVVQYVAENLFKLSPKDIEELEADVVGTIPKLLARAFVANQRNSLMQMAQLIPTMIQRQGEVGKRHTEAVGEFYTRWPDLGKAKDTQVTMGDKQISVGDLVTQYAVVYRKMHPEASRQDAIEAVGPMVMMAAKIVPGAAPPSAPQARPSPMAPTGASGRPPQPSPFVPAGPSAGGASPTTVPAMTAVEALFAGDPNEA